MNISRIRIQNFRAFEDETINPDNYTCFVGPNGSGKSTVLMALNVLFRNDEAPSNVKDLQEEEFHLRNTSVPIRITVTFSNLSDATKEDFKAYVRHDQLVITAKAEWNPDTERAEVKQIGSRQIIKNFAEYFEVESEGKKVAELKKIFAKLRENKEDIPEASTKEQMYNTLRQYEEEHPELCESIESENQFYGWSRGTNRLEKHCQWIYVLAVKDATQEQDETKSSSLGKLLQRTIRPKVDFREDLEEIKRDLGEKYREVISQEQSALDDTAK